VIISLIGKSSKEIEHDVKKVKEKAATAILRRCFALAGRETPKGKHGNGQLATYFGFGMTHFLTCPHLQQILCMSYTFDLKAWLMV
jgi:hypothetical protein